MHLEWLTFKHEGRQEFIADPVTIRLYWPFQYWDSGNIYCEAGCENSQINIHRPGPHMITDVNGNDLKWDEIRNDTIVKIRAMNTNWEGYNYLYCAPSGKYFHL